MENAGVGESALAAAYESLGYTWDPKVTGAVEVEVAAATDALIGAFESAGLRIWSSNRRRRHSPVILSIGTIPEYPDTVQVLVLNGPNLNLLGTREPNVYGTTTLRDLENRCRRWGKNLGLTVSVSQSNHEGELIDELHSLIGRYGGVVFNPGALSHYSYALHDAIVAIELPVVEVHISDIAAREEWRRHSVVSSACVATISGEGLDGYRKALEILAEEIS